MSRRLLGRRSFIPVGAVCLLGLSAALIADCDVRADPKAPTNGPSSRVQSRRNGTMSHR